MRVFVTGATGYVGSAIVRELIGEGHRVLGLARSDASAEALAAAGGEVQRGGLEDLGVLRAAAAGADGVIHTAFQNVGPNTDFAAACAVDRSAIEALGQTLAGSDRPLVVTSGTALVPEGRVATELDSYDAQSPFASLRGASEDAALAFARQGVRVSVVRLAPSVHSDADKHGFVPTLIALAREKGVSAYVGDGANRWPGVHRLDAAHLYRLALDGAPAGTRLHATDEEGVPFREIAGVIGRHLGLPVVSVSPEEAPAHFGWFAHFAAVDNPTSSALTRKELGWDPARPGLIADLEEGHYFQQ